MTTKAKAPPPKLEILAPGQAAPSRGLCIYGKSGSGKTTLLRTMPGRGLVVDVPIAEGGTEVLVGSDNIRITQVRDWDQLQAVHWFLAAGQHDYKWVAIDSVTACQALAWRKVVKERPESIKIPPHRRTPQEWGDVGTLLAELIWQFRGLPLYTIWTAQEQLRGDEDSGDRMWSPALSPAALLALMPGMRVVARLKVEYNLEGAVERHLILGPTPDMQTKYRAAPTLQVPPRIRNPSLGDVLRYLSGQSIQLDVVEDTFAVVSDAEEPVGEAETAVTAQT